MTDDTKGAEVAHDSELERLRAGFARIQAKRGREVSSFRGSTTYPTEYSRAWHDGYITAMAECSLIAAEATDPEGHAESEREWRLASVGTDREWFERTGCCGHCGNLAEDCLCTDDDPCECGPHPDRRTWPRDCSWCKGTGKIAPFATPAGAQ